MNEIAHRLAVTYHAQDLQPDHVVRRAIDALVEQDRRIAKLEEEAARHLTLARENGQLRDVARRERDEARAKVVEQKAALERVTEEAEKANALVTELAGCLWSPADLAPPADAANPAVFQLRAILDEVKSGR